MSGKIIKEAVFGVIKLKFESIFNKKRNIINGTNKEREIVNEGEVFEGDILIEGDRIVEVSDFISPNPNVDIIDVEGNYVLPGVIDDQVHFREPGLTHKANIETESKAAIAGGITSYIEMPNTNPQTTTIEELNNKFKIAEETSYANYSFMFGGTNNNLDEILKVDPQQVAGLKLFLGSSTGNMLVDDPSSKTIFKNTNLRISVHCEDEKKLSEITWLFIPLNMERIFL